MATNYSLYPGEVVNVLGGNPPYTITWPLGGDAFPTTDSNPTGVRNIGTGSLLLTAQAQTGEGFWVPELAQTLNSLQLEILPGYQHVFNWLPDRPAWVYYAPPPPVVDLLEWDSTSGWQNKVPQFPLHWVTVPGGVITTQYPVLLYFEETLTASILLPANNTDCIFRWEPIISAGTLLSKPLYASAASPRATTLFDTRYGTTAWDPVAAGSTIDFDVVNIEGAGTGTRDSILLTVVPL